MSGSDANTRDGKERAAAKRGCKIVEPLPNQLFIDIDCEADRRWFDQGIVRIASRWPCTVKITPSVSRKPHHEHIVVTFKAKTFTPIERIALQAVLGSDRHRELNSMVDIILGDPLPTIFFEPMVGTISNGPGTHPYGDTW